jgi:hypothetical protein
LGNISSDFLTLPQELMQALKRWGVEVRGLKTEGRSGERREMSSEQDGERDERRVVRRSGERREVSSEQKTELITHRSPLISSPPPDQGMIHTAREVADMWQSWDQMRTEVEDGGFVWIQGVGPKWLENNSRLIPGLLICSLRPDDMPAKWVDHSLARSGIDQDWYWVKPHPVYSQRLAKLDVPSDWGLKPEAEKGSAWQEVVSPGLVWASPCGKGWVVVDTLDWSKAVSPRQSTFKAQRVELPTHILDLGYNKEKALRALWTVMHNLGVELEYGPGMLIQAENMEVKTPGQPVIRNRNHHFWGIFSNNRIQTSVQLDGMRGERREVRRSGERRVMSGEQKREISLRPIGAYALSELESSLSWKPVGDQTSEIGIQSSKRRSCDQKVGANNHSPSWARLEYGDPGRSRSGQRYTSSGDLSEAETVLVQVKARSRTYSDPSPHMALTVDGQRVGWTPVSKPRWRIYSFEIPWQPGEHDLGVELVNNPNDAYNHRYLHVDWIKIQPTEHPNILEDPNKMGRNFMGQEVYGAGVE